MGMIEDVMKALERIPAWKRLATMPAELDALRNRVSQLEARLQPASGDICPRCREPKFILEDSSPVRGGLGDLGARQHRYRCSGCGFEDVRVVT